MRVMGRLLLPGLVGPGLRHPGDFPGATEHCGYARDRDPHAGRDLAVGQALSLKLRGDLVAVRQPGLLS